MTSQEWAEWLRKANSSFGKYGTHNMPGGIDPSVFTQFFENDTEHFPKIEYNLNRGESPELKGFAVKFLEVFKANPGDPRCYTVISNLMARFNLSSEQVIDKITIMSKWGKVI